MNLADIQRRNQTGRKVIGIAAILLPFTEEGAIAEEAYAALLEETIAAGLTPAVNMDTGYVNLQGRIPTGRTHPRSPARPSWEPEILADCARRLEAAAGCAASNAWPGRRNGVYLEEALGA